MAASEFRLTTPRVEVTLNDGSTFEVQAMNPDLIRWDRQAAKLGWPDATKAPFLWMTFIAWSAAKREGKLDPPDMPWELFGDERCIQVRNLTDDLEPDGADPTPPGPEPG